MEDSLAERKSRKKTTKKKAAITISDERGLSKGGEMSKLIFILFLAVGCSTSKLLINPMNDVEYVRNYDGDTITVNISNVHPLLGREIAVRVKGINTPEIRSKEQCAKELAAKAKLFTAERLRSAKRISLRECERGSFFRLVCDVEIDGSSLANLLLKRKLAIPYDGKSVLKLKWCTDAKDQD